MFRVSFTPFSVLNCFSLYVSLIVFICYHISYICCLFLLFFPPINYQSSFLCYDSVSIPCTPICLCLSGNLLYVSIYFSFVSLFTVLLSATVSVL